MYCKTAGKAELGLQNLHPGLACAPEERVTTTSAGDKSARDQAASTADSVFDARCSSTAGVQAHERANRGGALRRRRCAMTDANGMPFRMERAGAAAPRCGGRFQARQKPQPMCANIHARGVCVWEPRRPGARCGHDGSRGGRSGGGPWRGRMCSVRARPCAGGRECWGDRWAVQRPIKEASARQGSCAHGTCMRARQRQNQG